MVGGGRPVLSEIFGQTDPPLSKTAISNRYWLVVVATLRHKVNSSFHSYLHVYSTTVPCYFAVNSAKSARTVAF